MLSSAVATLFRTDPEKRFISRMWAEAHSRDSVHLDNILREESLQCITKGICGTISVHGCNLCEDSGSCARVCHSGHGLCGVDDSSCGPSSVATRVKSYDDSSMSLELLDEFEETTQQWRGQLTEYDTLSDTEFSHSNCSFRDRFILTLMKQM